MPKSSKEQISYFLLALVSVFLGFTVWVIIRHQETEIRTIPVNVDYENLPPFIELQDYEPKQLFVSFSLAKADELLLGQTGQFGVTVDLSSLSSKSINTQTFEVLPFRISQDDVQSPQNLTFVRFDSPDEVRVTARMRVTTARVSANIQGQPARGFELDLENIEITPQEVQVAVDSERNRLAQLTPLTVPTEPIDVTGRSESVTGIYGLIYSESSGIYPVPGRDKPTVDVLLEIPEIRENKVFPNIPIRFEPLRRDILATINPQVTSVTINGPSSILSTIKPEDINITPIPDQNLDLEEPGTSVEIALRVNLEIADPDARAKLSTSVSNPSVVISFSQLDRPSPLPTPEPIETPEPVSVIESESGVPEVDAGNTATSLELNVIDRVTSPTADLTE